MRREPTDHSNRSYSYRKEIIEQPTSNKIKQGLFNLSTNISYKIGGGLNKLKSLISSDSSKQDAIYIHGKQYATEEYARAYMRKIIWFSYRQLPGLSVNLHSDTGWGCLIRVGQMAMAAGLKAFLEGKKEKKHLIHQEIIIAFVESGGKEEKYSLKKIVEEANKKFGLTYGQWFNATQICDVLVRLHSRHPMRGTQNLEFIHFQGSLIYLDAVFQKLKIPLCQCQKRRILCENCNNGQHSEPPKPIESITSFSMHQPRKEKPFYENVNGHLMKSGIMGSGTKPEKKLIIFVSCRLGFQNIKKPEYDQLIELLSLECSLGIIGGIPRKGFYFVGYSGSQLIYLDPHYVQQEVTLSNLQYQLHTFESKQIRKASRSEIDPSMALVFYIDSLPALKKLHNKLQEIKDKHDNPIVMMEWVNESKSEELRVSGIEEERDGEDLENSFVQEL